MAKVTIADVAQYANVSEATVSRVLNGNDTVDETMRLRVLDAVQALGYKPSRIARRLRKDTQDVIGLIVSDIQNPHFVSIIKGVENTAYANKMNVLLCNSGEDSERLRDYVDVMKAESVAGLIAVPTSDEDAQLLASLREYNIPVVILDRLIEGFEADTVRSDNLAGASKLIDYLIENGYRRIGMIYPNVQTGEERYHGYCAALNRHSIKLDDALVKSDGHQIENGYLRTIELLQSSHPPEAIFTATNLMTIGALRAIRELGLHIPQDVALVGFDDLPYAEEFATPVTVVAQSTYKLGQRAVEVLMRRLNRPDLPYELHNLDTNLIVRASCLNRNTY